MQFISESVPWIKHERVFLWRHKKKRLESGAMIGNMKFLIYMLTKVYLEKTLNIDRI